MPVIKPISDLRNKANEISKIAHDCDEPIFITKNGEGLSKFRKILAD